MLIEIRSLQGKKIGIKQMNKSSKARFSLSRGVVFNAVDDFIDPRIFHSARPIIQEREPVDGSAFVDTFDVNCLFNPIHHFKKKYLNDFGNIFQYYVIFMHIN